MAATCAQGAFGRLAIKSGTSPYTWSGGTRLQYWRENIRFKGKQINPSIITGSLQENAERTRTGPGLYGGFITMPLNPADMVTLGPLFMGGTFSGTTCEYADTLPTFGVMIDKITDVYEYPNGIVNRVLISGKQNGPEGSPNWITMGMEILAKDENNGQTFPTGPTLSVAAEYTGFTFEDLTLTILGTARTPKEFQLLIDRRIEARYVNSVKPVLFCPSDLNVVLTARFPFDADHLDLHNQAIAGAAGSLALTNGTISTTFNFGNLQAPANTPETPGKTELDITTTLTARKSGSTDCITLVNDSTP